MKARLQILRNSQYCSVPPQVISNPISPTLSYRISPLYDKLCERFGDNLAIREVTRSDRVIRYYLPKIRNYINLLDFPKFQHESIHFSQFVHLLFNLPLEELEKKIIAAQKLEMPMITTRVLQLIDPDIHGIYNMDFMIKETRNIFRQLDLASAIQRIYGFETFSLALECCLRSTSMEKKYKATIIARENILKQMGADMDPIIVDHLCWSRSFKQMAGCVHTREQRHKSMIKMGTLLKFSAYDFFNDMTAFSRTGVTKYMDLHLEVLLGMIFECDPSNFTLYHSREKCTLVKMTTLKSATVVRSMGFTYEDAIHCPKSLTSRCETMWDSWEDMQSKGYMMPRLNRVVYYRSRGLARVSGSAVFKMFGEFKLFATAMKLSRNSLWLFKEHCKNVDISIIDLFHNRAFFNKKGFTDCELSQRAVVMACSRKTIGRNWNKFSRGIRDSKTISTNTHTQNVEILSLLLVYMGKQN